MESSCPSLGISVWARKKAGDHYEERGFSWWRSPVSGSYCGGAQVTPWDCPPELTDRLGIAGQTSPSGPFLVSGRVFSASGSRAQRACKSRKARSRRWRGGAKSSVPAFNPLGFRRGNLVRGGTKSPMPAAFELCFHLLSASLHSPFGS